MMRIYYSKYTKVGMCRRHALTRSQYLEEEEGWFCRKVSRKKMMSMSYPHINKNQNQERRSLVVSYASGSFDGPKWRWHFEDELAKCLLSLPRSSVRHWLRFFADDLPPTSMTAVARVSCQRGEAAYSDHEVPTDVRWLMFHDNRKDEAEETIVSEWSMSKLARTIIRENTYMISAEFVPEI